MNNNLTDNINKEIFQNSNETRIIKTNEDTMNGQDKCPRCGATDISLNEKTGNLRCSYCRSEFLPEKATGLEDDLSKLNGNIITSGASNIIADTDEILTLKCSSCGAEVVIDTSTSTQAKCHWCRNILSVNEQIPNGSIPDVVLPFNIPKKVAEEEIKKFVSKRKFFAYPKFKQEFQTENIMGVYFPYMLVDVNAHVNFSGQGEHQIREYTVKNGNSVQTKYDAELYNVEREFDLIIDNLSIESSSDKLNKFNSNKTNNVINAIMPFDTENCVMYNANFLKGYTSERRDTNVEQLKEIVDVQSKDIARYSANDTLTEYDRGVVWASEQLTVKGKQWKAAYLPVWLYSYRQVIGNRSILHYVAVNARTKEVMGSIPIHMPKLVIVSILVEIIGILAMIFVDWDYAWAFLTLGFIYYFMMYFKYRNSSARHNYETETKTKMDNIRKVDNYIEKRTGLNSPKMSGANNLKVSGQSFTESIISSFNNKI